MKVTIIKKNKLIDFVLPMQVHGNYWIKDEDRNLIEEITNLSENYNNAVLWLKIPGTSIDTPVFQSSDNDFYLSSLSISKTDF